MNAIEASAVPVGGVPPLEWQEAELTLVAHSMPRLAHPLSVFEALIKGAREAAGIASPLLWYWPGQGVEAMTYRPGQRIELKLQLFSVDAAAAAQLQAALQERLTPAEATTRHFSLETFAPWQMARPGNLPSAPAWRMEFHTPLPLPKKGQVDRTAVSSAEFLFACRKRIKKLWGLEAPLPPAPVIEAVGWRYWRTTHRSRSQGGEPLLLNGCLGQLRVSGEHLDAWLPWLALFARVGLGERLGFSLGRMMLLAETLPGSAPALASGAEDEPEPLRRPLHIERTGCKLSLENENIVLEGGETTEEGAGRERYPLRLLESVQCSVAVQFTSSLCGALGEHGVPLVVSQPGLQTMVLVRGQSEYQHNRNLAAHHRAHDALSDAQQARLAARWVQAKLKGHAVLIRSRYQAGDNQLLVEFDRAIATLSDCDSVDAARGWEGLLARRYYPWLSEQHPEVGCWQGRVRQGGTPDAMNALLNYGYALLRARIELAVRAQGLDPYLGILHAANGRHAALVSDFMEPLRAHVDRLLLRMLGLAQIRRGQLEATADGIRLNSAARRTYVNAFAMRARQGGGRSLLRQLENLARGYLVAIENGTLADWNPGEHLTDEAGHGDEQF